MINKKTPLPVWIITLSLVFITVHLMAAQFAGYSRALAVPVSVFIEAPDEAEAGEIGAEEEPSPETAIVPAQTCVPEPACRAATPPCMLPEPAGGWCLSSSPIPSGDPSISPIPGGEARKAEKSAVESVQKLIFLILKWVRLLTAW